MRRPLEDRLFEREETPEPSLPAPQQNEMVKGNDSQQSPVMFRIMISPSKFQITDHLFVDGPQGALPLRARITNPVRLSVR
jgi:hypothetical protein